MDNQSHKTPFNQNLVINDNRLSDQNMDLYQHPKEKGNEDFGGNESMCTANEVEENINLYQYDGECGNEDFSSDESMRTAKIEREEMIDPYQYDDGGGNEDLSGDERMRMNMTDGDRKDESNNEDRELDNIPEGWKYVEVAGSFDHLTKEGGGGFVLRDWEARALLAQAFPAPGDSVLFVKTYAFHKAMEEIIALKEEDVVFCLESEALYDCIQRDCIVPVDILAMLKDCIKWSEKHSFRVFLWKEEKLEAAIWLSVRGKRSRQHCQWDMAGPWPPGLNLM